MLSVLILLSIVKADFNQAVEHVDLVELNHFHDCLGRHVYDQVIFYEWSHEVAKYHVRSWILVDDAKRIPRRNYSDNTWRVQYPDMEQKLERSITSQHFRESWSQVDPERENKKILDERLRHKLIQRIDPKPVMSPIEEPLGIVGGMK